jgi:hypothetical protein
MPVAQCPTSSQNWPIRSEPPLSSQKKQKIIKKFQGRSREIIKLPHPPLHPSTPNGDTFGISGTWWKILPKTNPQLISQPSRGLPKDGAVIW